MISTPEILDPRTRRTRTALQQALETLLSTTDFEKISVQDISEAAGLNRATFYDHYSDKFALLESMVESRFHQLLEERAVVFTGCSSALRKTILGVCDFLATLPRLDCARQRQLEPHWESAMIAVVRRTILRGIEHEPRIGAIEPRMVATTVSWAIYGAAKEWVHTPNRRPSEEIGRAADGVHPCGRRSGLREATTGEKNECINGASGPRRRLFLGRPRPGS
jgi:AcrR family transcriptional regulator